MYFWYYATSHREKGSYNHVLSLLSQYFCYYGHKLYFFIFLNLICIIIVFVQKRNYFQHSVLRTMATLGVSQALPVFPISVVKHRSSFNSVNWIILRAHLICFPFFRLTVFYSLSNKQCSANCFIIYFVCFSGKVKLVPVMLFWSSKIE